MIAVYIILGTAALVGVLVLLDFFGPTSSETPFWTGLRRIRAVLDKVSYGIICAIAVGSVALVAFELLRRLVP